MKKTTSAWIGSTCAAVLMLLPSFASAQNHDAELARGAKPDTTAEQRYQTAIREAGGGLKVALAECKAQTADRKTCEREARENYKSDMAFARHLRANPDARPTQVDGGAIRSTEVTTIRQLPAK